VLFVGVPDFALSLQPSSFSFANAARHGAYSEQQHFFIKGLFLPLFLEAPF